MLKCIVQTVGLFWIASAIQQSQPKAMAQSQAADWDYVKVEVRGTLNVSARSGFDPHADPKNDLGIDLTAAIPPNLGAGFECQLLISDRKLYDMARSWDKKKVTVTGELERIYIGGPAYRPQDSHVKQYIRVRDIRLADSK